MTETEFEQWRNNLLSLTRYENPTDARTFVKLARDVQDQLDGRVIDMLLDTFCDDDDYGIQESILVVLDKADAKLYAERLAIKFPDLRLEHVCNMGRRTQLRRIGQEGRADLSVILWAGHIMRGKGHGYADEDEKRHCSASGSGPRADEVMAEALSWQNARTSEKRSAYDPSGRLIDAVNRYSRVQFFFDSVGNLVREHMVDHYCCNYQNRK